VTQYLFRMPDIGEGIAEVEITAWHVKVGDRVNEDDPLLDVVTDKATVDMTSPVDGTVTALHGDVGGMARVGGVLIEFDVDGAVEIPAEEAEPVQPPPEKPASAPAPAPAATVAPVNPDPTAAPATRRRAKEWGIRLEDVIGTGPRGRILVEDLERYREAQRQPSGPAPREGVETIPVVGVRRRIAERMQLSKQSIPHFSYVEECDVTELEALRAELNRESGDGQRLTLLPFFMQALIRLLPEFPDMNAHYDEAEGVLKRYRPIHIGIATQTDRGLMVPVVRHAEALDLRGCARELARVTTAARDGSARPEDLSDSTITLTSLGPLGGLAATPIINHPEVAIIGPNKVREEPVIDGSFIIRRKKMNLSGSFDHRIIDGYEAARFVQAFRRLIAHPALLFMN